MGVLCIQTPWNPSPWLHAKLAATDQPAENPKISDHAARVARIEQLWRQFFADPSQWWDNRFSEKSPRYPDFKHKATSEALWVDYWWNPPWVKAKVAAMSLDNARSSGGQRSRGINSFGYGDEVKRLCQEGRFQEAIQLMKLMVQRNGDVPAGALVSLLKECGRRKILEEGRQVHTLMIQSRCDSNTFLANNLIDMFSKCGSVPDAYKVFTEMPQRNLFSWTAIISAYANNGQCEEAINLFQQMQANGIVPDKVAFVVALKACACITALEQGRQLHLDIRKRGFEPDVMVQNTLIDMYAKCGCLEDAHKLFHNMSERDVISWTVMIEGYVENDRGEEALALYKQMKEDGVQPNKVTSLVVLKACASTAALEQGKQLHSDMKIRGYELDPIVQNTLVDMYAKCGCLEEAREVFDNMGQRSTVSWTVLIGGYVDNGLGKEALALYEQMKQEGVQPNKVTYIVLLKACASVTALEQGKQLHADIRKRGFETCVTVQNILVDMYAKCGCLEYARKLFDNMSKRTVVSWTVMIGAYGQNGLGKEALALYEQMKKEGVQPNRVTYICVLSACSHSGLVDECRHVFDSMLRNNNVTPTLEHYACVVDLLGRVGCLSDAEELIIKMPIQPNGPVWMSLLGAARNCTNVEIGKRAFDRVVDLEPENPAPYLLLTDIYKAAGMMEEVRKLRNEMDYKGLKNVGGCSWIEAGNQVHSFIAGDVSHTKSEQIWAEMKKLVRLMKKEGYIPDLSLVLDNLEDDMKELALCKHSVKLAIAFGLISLPSCTPIRIKKNVSVCRDCHNAAKIISKIVKREIIVMDAYRFHHFKEGTCTCRDYW